MHWQRIFNLLDNSYACVYVVFMFLNSTILIELVDLLCVLGLLVSCYCFNPSYIMNV